MEETRELTVSCSTWALLRTWTEVQKGPRPTLPTKASPGSLTYISFYLKLCNYSLLYLSIYVSGVGIETLDA
jgi:hypothetical protein